MNYRIAKLLLLVGSILIMPIYLYGTEFIDSRYDFQIAMHNDIEGIISLLDKKSLEDEQNIVVLPPSLRNPGQLYLKWLK